MKLTLLAFTPLLFVSTSLAEEVLFQLKFEPGKVYLSDTVVEQKSSMTMGGQVIASTMKMTSVTSQTVAKVEKGIQITQKMDSLKMDMNAGGMEMTFDSANPQGPMAMMMGPMMEAKSVVTVDSVGKVLEVKAEVAPGLENLGMGEDEVSQSGREFFDWMPNKKVSEGESWTSSSSLPLGGMVEGPLAINYTFTFDSLVEQDGHKLAKVLIKGEVDGGDDNLKVTSKELGGEMFFDPQLGYPREVSLLMDLEIGLPDGEEATDGPGKMPMRMQTTTKLKEIK